MALVTPTSDRGGGALAAGGRAHAQGPSSVDVAGVRFEPTATVGGQGLGLNGAGLRTRFGLEALLGAQRAATPPGLTY